MGSLLITRKNNTSAHLPSNPTQQHKWTGTFALFSFPRELRDQIYFWYLLRPGPIPYTRHTTRSFPFDAPEELTSLLCTSRQVYTEAFPIFYRYNAVNFGRNTYDHRSKRLDGVLRLFPAGPAQVLQRATNEYASYPSSRNPETAGDVWLQMLRDAHVMKAFFPKLREFTAGFTTGLLRLQDEGVVLGGVERSYEEKVELWLEWMRRYVKKGSVVPVEWLRVELKNSYREPWLVENQGLMDEAYARLLKETSGFRSEYEESGPLWVEESWNEGTKKRKRRLRRLEGQV